MINYNGVMYDPSKVVKIRLNKVKHLIIGSNDGRHSLLIRHYYNGSLAKFETIN